jgi:hypothetical protein
VDLHERLEPLSFLVGTWRGLGVVGYPTIEDGRYEQEVVFAHDGCARARARPAGGVRARSRATSR